MFQAKALEKEKKIDAMKKKWAEKYNSFYSKKNGRRKD